MVASLSPEVLEKNAVCVWASVSMLDPHRNTKWGPSVLSRHTDLWSLPAQSLTMTSSRGEDTGISCLWRVPLPVPLHSGN